MRTPWWIAFLVLSADRAAKLTAANLTTPVTLLPGVLQLCYAENTGMAFSLFSGYPWLLGLLSLLILTTGFFLLRRYRLGSLSRIAAMFILGGALGNLIDRIFLGYVVDMIEFLFVRFAIFNVADAFLCIGCFLMALSLLFHPEEWSKKDGTST